MTVTYRCGDNAALVGYLYDDCAPGEAAAIAAHLADCPACTAELASLQFTRDGLQAWTPPEVALGFKVVQDPPVAVLDAPQAETGSRAETGRVLRPARWWSRPLPAWAQAAAAVALFAAGAALGTLRAGGLSPVTPSGTAADAATATAQVAAQPAAANGGASASDLAALEQRLRDEIQSQVSQLQATPVSAPAGTQATATMDQAALLQQVKALIQQSEQRQQHELALRTAEVVRDLDSQRRGDLARIERTFGQMEGNTGVQVEQQRQMLNYLMRVSQRQPQ